MRQDAIFSPFFATIFLTFVVWVYLYIQRISFINRSKLRPADLMPSKFAQISPPSVSTPADNLKNLFEIPVLFYAIVLYLFATQQVDTMYVITAWVFAIFRALHSAVHCTFNWIMLRFYLYLASCLAVGLMTIQAAIVHFG
ncbi:MAG TPA: MAPEG family protein [Leptolyngbya sp.]|jgi:hypothetical protein|nr:MAPEG family protein [Leptolyngbya sp.]